ncbi:putative RNA methyltransferase [Nonomuraea soli]|uniref:23S rRNA (Guanine745-N1)-methyltransferase n=1 Tax=Nonomuraea soli TaxID=1032476 RepID=A0A7W0HQ37_9ACTN|nr:methyltransferase domain-containing protein [Nonomuraea soli]MBA2891503.1 23S rRNA (guanine745-N1)-methyltransferase [Nonomuraea soli]
MLADIVDHLRCPVCHDPVRLADGAVRCPRRHAFDVARQGYVSFLAGSQAPGTADTPEMVAARADFLAAGHYAPLATELSELAAKAVHGSPVVVDAGAGTGYYLAAVLDGLPGATGIAFDISKHAIKRAARAHERLGAFVADVWKPLPIADNAADLLLDVFAPRNGPEFLRVLRPGGRLVVVTPGRSHLSPLVDELGLLSVDDAKEQRISRSLAGFTEVGRRTVRAGMLLGSAEIVQVVAMGPSAWHTDMSGLKERLAKNHGKVAVEAEFHLSTFEALA